VDPENHYERGLAYALTGRGTQALEDLDEAIRLKPDHVQARCCAVRFVCAATTTRPEARTSRPRSASRPTMLSSRSTTKLWTCRRDASALYGRGLARLRQGQAEQGERDIAAALAIDAKVAAQFTAMGLTR
jgi:tetratricopeptide (TPR) repeat protein